MRAVRRGWRWVARPLLWLVALLVALVLLLALLTWVRMGATLPQLEGARSLPGLSAPVTIERDAEGVPTISGQTRADLARALGFLHGQERFFQMDQARRVAAGELGEVLGPLGAGFDERLRVHRFRARAAAEAARLTPAERAIVQAYAEGVNAGLAALGRAPFEYRLLGLRPRPWAAEDMMLVGYAMYLQLQGAGPGLELERANVAARVGRPMAELLFPSGGALDSPLDGGPLPEPPMPNRLEPPEPGATGGVAAPIRGAPMAPPPDAEDGAPRGSNAWAVAGAHSATGAAMVANDMHLGLSAPGIWYRARLRMPGLDITGVTLPGAPHIVVGSNGRVAWGFTNSYIDLHDAVVLEPVPGRPDAYRTPAGPRDIVKRVERIGTRLGTRKLVVEETIWGPVVARLPDGRRVVDRWVAHRPGAVTLQAYLDMERARSTPELLAIAHRTSLANQNIFIGDADGRIAWTIIGRIPRRVGFDGRWPESWADGDKRWDGWLAPAEVPVRLDPPGGRLWSGNQRLVGGAEFARLGDGGYDNGARAERIRQRLAASDRFDEAAMLAIQLDNQSDRNRFWHARLLMAIDRAGPGDAGAQALRPHVAAWGGRADPASVGHRLIDRFRRELFVLAMDAYAGPAEPGSFRPARFSSQTELGLRRLLMARPAALVPPGFASWDELEARALAGVVADVAREAGGDPARYTWGAWMRPAVAHPIGRFLPPLGWIANMPARPQAGDTGVPNAFTRGSGPSQRLAVSPGYEARGLFHMPAGQAGNPRSPLYRAGHEAWASGRPAPFLPGPPRWRLTLAPPAAPATAGATAAP
jgi:penicillin amidase